MEEKVRVGKVDRVVDGLYRLIESVNLVLIIVMVASVSYTVFGRFVLKKAPSWGEEVGTFCMVWIALLSSSLAVKDGRHIRMTVINLIFPKKVCIRLHQMAYVVVFAVGCVMLVNGIEVAKLAGMAIMPALGISRIYLYSALPVSGAAILLMLIGKVRDGKW